MTFSKDYLSETSAIAAMLDAHTIEKAASLLAQVRDVGGRLFILGVGGSAGTSSHAVNDFRKICKIESYTPVDNVSELTAITNDKGWEYAFVDWLMESRLNQFDALLIFSVGGGSRERNLSVNLVDAVIYAKSRRSKVISVVGRHGGDVAENSDVFIQIPPLVKERVTPHTEEFHAVIAHLLVTHPLLKATATTWESK